MCFRVSNRREGVETDARATHLNPAFFLHLHGVVFGLGSIHRESLTWRSSKIVGAADGGPLPVLHLGERGWTRRRCWRRGYRHQTTRQGQSLAAQDDGMSE